jgi:quercetin dioxygenase-like cupin family protein
MYVFRQPQREVKGVQNLIVTEDSTGAEHCQAGIARIAANTILPDEGWAKHPTEEVNYILKGKIRVQTPTRSEEIGKGDMVFMPKDEEHRNINIGDDEALILWVTAPPTL